MLSINSAIYHPFYFVSFKSHLNTIIYAVYYNINYFIKILRGSHATFNALAVFAFKL